MMKAKWSLLLTLSILPTFALAEVEEDISTLIKRLSNPLTFIRNGKAYTNRGRQNTCATNGIMPKMTLILWMCL